MQNSHFDNNGYQGGLYGTSPGYDAGTIKLHHGHYPDSDSCFGNYVGTCTSAAPNLIARDPPSYAESTLFHPGFVPSSSTTYYKVPGRQMELGDYGRNSEQLLIKPELQIPTPGLEYIHRYEAEESKIIPEIDANSVKLEVENDDFKKDLSSSLQNEPTSEAVSEDSISQMTDKDLDEEGKSNNVEMISAEKEDERNKTNTEVKPSLSYIALIAKSILESPQRRLNLGSIYSWIEKNYPYYQNRGQGWRNSVRHNLSLNDCFIKAGRCEDGKGNYWAIHPANIQDFMRGDFRQRRRSRRRGRKKDGDFGMYPLTNGYLGPTGSTLTPGVPFNHPATLSSIYSPYTEAERRAYRLDEALLRQSMNNPFLNWYRNGSYNGSTGTPCNAGMYGGGGGTSQWQGYNDNSQQSVYQLNSSFSSCCCTYD